MASTFTRDLTDSSADFLRVVWPIIRPWMGGGSILPVEGNVDAHLAQALDRHAGIDAWHIVPGKGVRGVASRVQWIEPQRTPWNTFTLRYARESGTETEFSKRKKSLAILEDGWVFPSVTVQAYVDYPRGQGNLRSVAVMNTPDLLQAFDDILTVLHENYANEVIEACIAGNTSQQPIISWHQKAVAGMRHTSGATFVWCHWDALGQRHPLLGRWDAHASVST